VTLEDPRTSQLKVIWMDRRWFPARKCKRDDTLGIWPCVGLTAGPASPKLQPASTEYSKTGDPRIDRLAPSLVSITFDMPYSVSGVTEKNYHGTGVIVDTKRGLVVIDRNTVRSPWVMSASPSTARWRCRARSNSFIRCTISPWCLRSEADRQHAGAGRDAGGQGASSGDDVWVVGQRAIPR